MVVVDVDVDVVVAAVPVVVIESEADTVFPGTPPVTDSTYVVPAKRDSDDVCVSRRQLEHPVPVLITSVSQYA